MAVWEFDGYVRKDKKTGRNTLTGPAGEDLIVKTPDGDMNVTEAVRRISMVWDSLPSIDYRSEAGRRRRRSK